MLKRDIHYFLDSVENGKPSITEGYHTISNFEPILGYFLLQYLREKYPPKEGSEGPHGRLLELLTTYKEIASYLRPTKEDQIYIEWFEDNYYMKDYFQSRK